MQIYTYADAFLRCKLTESQFAGYAQRYYGWMFARHNMLRCPGVTGAFTNGAGTLSRESSALTVTLFNGIQGTMELMRSAEKLAEEVNRWCDQHGVAPASGQAGEQITERSIRYYRTLGLVDPALLGGGQGYGEKHRLQLVAIRLLQAQGLPLNRIRDLVFGRTLEEFKRIEKQGLEETSPTPVFRPALSESWGVTPLDEEFLLISRRGRGLSPELRERLLKVLNGGNRNNRRSNGMRKDH